MSPPFDLDYLDLWDVLRKQGFYYPKDYSSVKLTKPQAAASVYMLDLLDLDLLELLTYPQNAWVWQACTVFDYRFVYKPRAYIHSSN